MGQKTNISWTNRTHNFWFGCKKVSPGCKNCYAERDMKRFGKDFNTVTKAKGFDKPLSWKDPAMVFPCSWSDFFIEDADEWRDDAWDIIRQTPHLTYQILTKRVENIPDRLPADWGDGWDNVWLGVSVESQEYIHRAHALNQIPAKIRFVSAEPLLGEIYLSPHLTEYKVLAKAKRQITKPYHGIDWVIAGGESGPNCRSMELDWARSIKEGCDRAEVAFFMKQDSGPKPGMRGRIPDDLWIQEFPEVN